MLETHQQDGASGRTLFRDAFKPQELSNTAWGVATLLSKKKKDHPTTETEERAALTILRHVAHAVSERAGEFKTQELSNTAWAFATLGFGISLTALLSEKDTISLNDYVVLTSEDPKGDEELLVRATNAILESAQSRFHKFRSQELNNLAWALARLDRRDATDALEAIGLQLCDKRRFVTPQVRRIILDCMETTLCIVLLACFFNCFDDTKGLTFFVILALRACVCVSLPRYRISGRPFGRWQRWNCLTMTFTEESLADLPQTKRDHSNHKSLAIRYGPWPPQKLHHIILIYTTLCWFLRKIDIRGHWKPLMIQSHYALDWLHRSSCDVLLNSRHRRSKIFFGVFPR
jgi:hypothetical protein